MPTKYTRQHDYSNATVPELRSVLNPEYDAIENSIDETIEALADIRRADGALNNGIVTLDSLHAEVIEYLDDQLAIASGFADDAANSASQAASSATASASSATASANSATESANSAAESAASAEDAQEAAAGIEEMIEVTGAVYVDTYAGLKGFTDPDTTLIVQGRNAVADGAHGIFTWQPGDQSDNVDADPGEGVWVAPFADTTGKEGAWRRQHQGIMDVRWFGAVGDGVTDDYQAIQNAIDSYSNLYFAKAGPHYLVQSQLRPRDGLIMRGDADILLGGAVIKSTAASMFIVDGQNANANNRVGGMVIQGLRLHGDGTNQLTIRDVDSGIGEYSFGRIERCEIAFFDVAEIMQTGMTIAHNNFWTNRKNVIRGADGVVRGNFFNTRDVAISEEDGCVELTGVTETVFADNYITAGEPSLTNTIPIALRITAGYGLLVANNRIDFANQQLVRIGGGTRDSVFHGNNFKARHIDAQDHAVFIGVTERLTFSNNIFVEIPTGVDVAFISGADSIKWVGNQISGDDPVHDFRSADANTRIEVRQPELSVTNAASDITLRPHHMGRTITNTGATGTVLVSTPISCEPGEFFFVRRTASHLVRIFDRITQQFIYDVDNSTPQIVRVSCYVQDEWTIDTFSV